jgi:hypothetical protein
MADHGSSGFRMLHKKADLEEVKLEWGNRIHTVNESLV